MKKRNTSKTLAAKSGNVDDFNQYKTFRNLVVDKLKKAKVNYYRGKFDDNSTSPKEIWKTAYEILGSSKGSFPAKL